MLAIRVYNEKTVEEVIRRRARFKQDLDSATTDNLDDEHVEAIVREFSADDISALFLGGSGAAPSAVRSVDQLQAIRVEGA